MILNTLNWKAILNINNHKISFLDAIRSIGLSIFTKYIPGKVFVILGRAEYISFKYPINRKVSTTISLETQFISIWVGLGMGVLGLILAGGLNKYAFNYLTIIAWGIISVFIFSPIIKVSIEKLSFRLLKKQINLPHTKITNVIRSLPYFMMNWLAWTAGFYFLCNSVIESNVNSLSLGLGFPLAATIGIIAIVSPGGLGVREAVIAYYLSLFELSLVEITTISVFSRLWFLFGEAFIFFLALILEIKERNPKLY